MDFLKAEIERKRKQLEAAASKSNGSASTDSAGQPQAKKPKKYIRRGDLERIREQEYLEEQKKLEEERRRRAQRTASNELNGRGEQEEHAATKHDQDDKDDEDEDDDISGTTTLAGISEEEITRRLRARDEPIRLFGETSAQRLKRLRICESRAMERNDSGRNDFRELLEDTEERLMEEQYRREKGEIVDASASDPFADIDTTCINHDLYRSNQEKCITLITIYFKRLMREWSLELQARPDEEKRSMQGKLQTATQKQADEYMKPFFKNLKRNTLPPDVVEKVVAICDYLQKREYVQAEDNYLRMSIGNAPWPIGVTMVGIHARSAREKISAGQVAHALNDETTRKWIQSIKRLMTFAQKKYPAYEKKVEDDNDVVKKDSSE